MPTRKDRSSPVAGLLGGSSRDPDAPPPDPKRAPGEERNELMRLAVVAAHQLKSPMASVQTIHSLLLGGFVGPISPRQRELLEKANASCVRGTHVVSDLLRLRSLDVLSSDDLVPHNLAATFRTAVERVRSLAETAQIHLKDRVDLENPDACWILADPGSIGEILLVVLENAIKYTPREGDVSVRLFEQAPGEGEPRPSFGVEVVDTGIGIPTEALPRLFTDFYRAPNAKAQSQDGTGLGLAFAARAMALHGGTIRLEPADTGGARALLLFPLAPASVLGAHAPLLIAGRRAYSRRVVVIGGVAAGSKAAARVMRLDPDAHVTVLERGRFLSYAGCGLPYYISGTVRDQAALLSSPLGDVRDSAFFHNLKNVTTLDRVEATRIDRERKVVTARNLVDNAEMELPYDRLVLATGARAVKPPVPGVDLDGIYTLHGVEDAEAIRSALRSSSAKEVVIVGGGLLGCEITESVALRGSRITLVEREGNILGIVDPEIAMLVERHMLSRGVKVLKDTEVVAFGGNARVHHVSTSDGRRLPCDFVILAAGVVPDVALARRAGLEIGPTGAIAVDRFQRTSDPDIWAAGDCAENYHLLTQRPVWIPLGSTATKQGRVAATNVCGGEEVFPGVVGNIILKVFDVNIGCVGLTERDARLAGFDPVTTIVSGPDRDHYLPTASRIVLKMVADRATRLLLGLQGVGPGEVVKRIDVAATALTARMDLDTLAQLDLGYAPPYSLAMDTILIAANVLRNKIDGMYQGISSLELHRRMKAGEPLLLIDVRLPAEYGVSRLPGSRHVPLGSLRGRLQEIPRDRPLVLIGKVGLRAYEAALVLRKAGFHEVLVLDGGLDAWPFEVEQL